MPSCLLFLPSLPSAGVSLVVRTQSSGDLDGGCFRRSSSFQKA